jgi:citrate synthase
MEEKSLYPNVDFYTASVLSASASSRPLHLPVRRRPHVRLDAHIREQYADNRLIRPDSEYVGPDPRPWTPLEDRG